MTRESVLVNVIVERAKAIATLVKAKPTPARTAAVIKNNATLQAAAAELTALAGGAEHPTAEPPVVSPPSVSTAGYNYADWQDRVAAASTAAGIDPAGGPGANPAARKAALDAYDPSGKLYQDAVNGGRFGHPSWAYKLLGDQAAPPDGPADALFTRWSIVAGGTPSGTLYLASKDGQQISEVLTGDWPTPAEIADLDAKYGI